MGKTESALSPIVGTLLLTLLTVSVSVFLYNFVAEPVGKALEEKSSKETICRLALTDAFINDTCLKISVRNNYDTSTTIALCYVNDVPHNLNSHVHVPRNAVATIILEGRYQKGTTYRVKLVSILGVSSEFQIPYTDRNSDSDFKP